VNQRQRAALADRYQSDGMKGSSPQKLLLAVFDRLQRDVATAAAALGPVDGPAEPQAVGLAGGPGAIGGGAVDRTRIEVAHKALLNAQELVYELILALDEDVWPAAQEMRAVYHHLVERLVEANLAKTPELVARCAEIIDPLAETWREADRALAEQRVAAAMAATGSATVPGAGQPGAVS
jgi:flagellar protein FliS